VSKENTMNMSIILTSANGREFVVDVRFASDGLYILYHDEAYHFNDLTRENKQRVLRHFMKQAGKVA